MQNRKIGLGMQEKLANDLHMFLGQGKGGLICVIDWTPSPSGVVQEVARTPERARKKKIYGDKVRNEEDIKGQTQGNR